MVPFGTDETISRVVETYSPMLLRLACTRLDSTADAEDAVQETFLKLLTAKPVFRDAEHEKAWLIRTTLHRASDIRRLAEKRSVPLEEAAQAAAPSMDLFSMTRDGAISMRDSVVGTLFTLPLDKSLADPAAAQALVESTGIEYTPITDEELAVVDTERPEVVISGEDGEKLITIGGTAAQGDGAMEPFTAESFEAYMAAEVQRMKGELAGGILSQETYDKTAAELEEVLAGLKDGTMAAFLDGENTLVTGTASNDDYGFEYSGTGNGTVGAIITDAK